MELIHLAKKIKADLIDRAKLKKSYAKVLKAEGMESERVKDRTKAVETPEVSSGEAGDNQVDGGGEKRGESSRPKRPVSTYPLSTSALSSTRPPRPDASSYKGKGKARDSNLRPQSRSRYPSNPSDPSSSSAPVPPRPRKQRALSPIPISHPMPITELRQLKKDAYTKYHPPNAVRSVSGQSAGSGTNSRSGLGGLFGFASGGKSRGQPNMGARMGVLLEQIQRDRAPRT